MRPYSCRRARTQVGKYQEQPQLLDPLLEGIVAPLAALLRSAAAAPAAADLRRVRDVSRLLWQLSMVRWVAGWMDGWVVDGRLPRGSMVQSVCF